MMWYVYELEKAENEEDGAIDEEKWRKRWLERLERRECVPTCFSPIQAFYPLSLE